MTPAQSQKTLYDQDFVAWLDDTVSKLKQRRFAEIDLESLVEEVEGLAKRDRRELKTRLEVLLSHLLKRLYLELPDNYRGWESTIREQRRRLNDLLEQSPSLRTDWQEVFSTAWRNALLDTQEDYPNDLFPEQWQFSIEIDALLNEKFWKNH